MDTDKLTGNTRLRPTLFFRKLVLQVEISCKDYDIRGGGSYSPAYTKWRDASFKDLEIIN